jgi:hypothetical protein
MANVDLVAANLEEADLSGAVLDDANLDKARAPRAKFRSASLLRCTLTDCSLESADLSGADARHANLTGASLGGAILTGAKIFGAQAQRAKPDGLVAEWVDNSPAGDGVRRIGSEDVARVLQGRASMRPRASRYFGKGDVLRDATLEFGDGSSVEIESRFEKCNIALGDSTELVIAESGVLKDCVIRGGGNITIHGEFYERQSPGIVGPRTLIVSSKGALVGAVQQTAEPTRFAFEPGCRLRMKILRART